MKNKTIVKFIVALIVPQLFGIMGSLFTNSSMESWYAFLNKPSFNPPNWLFAPVWTLLFLLMGIALFLVWKEYKNKKEVKFAILIFAFQLTLNVFWTFIFFGLKNPAIAFTEIISLWFAILATLLAFYQVNKKAGYLMIPYIAWVTFAAVLNYSIWMLN